MTVPEAIKQAMEEWIGAGPEPSPAAPAPPTFVPAGPAAKVPVFMSETEAVPPEAARAHVDVGALLERGREERAQAGRQGPRPKAVEMCRHRLFHCRECHGS